MNLKLMLLNTSDKTELAAFIPWLGYGRRFAFLPACSELSRMISSFNVDDVVSEVSGGAWYEAWTQGIERINWWARSDVPGMPKTHLGWAVLGAVARSLESGRGLLKEPALGTIALLAGANRLRHDWIVEPYYVLERDIDGERLAIMNLIEEHGLIEGLRWVELKDQTEFVTAVDLHDVAEHFVNILHHVSASIKLAAIAGIASYPFKPSWMLDGIASAIKETTKRREDAKRKYGKAAILGAAPKASPQATKEESDEVGRGPS